MALDREETRFVFIWHTATPACANMNMEGLHHIHLAQQIRSDRGTKSGWHFLIRRDGRLEKGRDLEEIGCHLRGYNHNSIAIGLVGGCFLDGEPEDNFTRQQWETLEETAAFLSHLYPNALFASPQDVDSKAQTPAFDVDSWAYRRGFQT